MKNNLNFFRSVFKKGFKFPIVILVILLSHACSENDDPEPTPAPEQNLTLHVSGKDLMLPNDEKIILRGINYPIIDAYEIGYPDVIHYLLDEASKTGANCIRFPWYTNGKHFWDGPLGHPGLVDSWVADGSLKDMLAYSHQKGMIPILELHDPGYITCTNDWNYFNTVVADWWKSENVRTLIEQTQEYLIINLANEFGHVRFGADPNALNTFKSNYIQLILSLRNLGIKVPIMIDAPDCGTSSSELLSIAEEMLQADPLHNLIFSVHAYWYGYASTPVVIDQKLDEINNKDVCFVFGEIANFQDVNECGSQNILDITTHVLEKACSNQIGWLAWTYDQDCSAPREMTTDGSFLNLTEWGNFIVNDPEFGLKSNAGCGAH
ncbi:hypothetical protein EI546_04610 [Aequorivita sp. H23M31]|uniref:Glycoside hydrolase family 5 domain-containing protein n=1 Tax=Aequorivita ciconiae TaxID=2494375 RepID=A0A410G1D9_9FLAO|nr:cellulase family glycosylhydrolase [Aequorivita sp. H23M31]QAA81050.1 hypothetical protein EI546_04610 [Aequorivita sp. H23M31]